MFDLGDGKIEVGILEVTTGEDARSGGPVKVRIDETAWLLWWSELEGSPFAWIPLAQQRFKDETGVAIGPGQARRLLAKLAGLARDFFADAGGP